MLCIVPFLNLFPDTDINPEGQASITTSKVNGFAVVELFTSEGCSSCPSADELITKLEKDASGKNVYLLAYHVDYWDRLGWKDKFSFAEFTSRQRQYFVWMKLKTIYTPQFVVNGTSEFGGSNQNQLYNLVSDGLLKTSSSTLKLSAQDDKKSLKVTYKTNNSIKNTKLIVALIQKQANSKIERGENKGRQLKHVQIVNHFKSFSINKKEDSLIIYKPENFTTTGWEMIGFIQDESTGTITVASKADFQ